MIELLDEQLSYKHVRSIALLSFFASLRLDLD